MQTRAGPSRAATEVTATLRPPGDALCIGERPGESGTALIFAIILTVSVGALVMAHMGEVNSERRKIDSIMHRQRATERAVGELERARNIVNAAPYINGKNTALWAAIHSDPPYVPGTEVRVERVGPTESEWHVLRATGSFQNISKLAQVFVRQRSPITSFNLFVADHPVGVSGTPTGQIHTNKELEFMFPYGTYKDSVSACDGYKFSADATPDNTRLWGPSNPAAAPMHNVLSSISFSSIATSASTLCVTDDLLAEVAFQGPQTQVDLYTPETRTLVPRTGYRRVFTGFTDETARRKVMDYVDVPYRIKVPQYTEVTEHVTIQSPVYTWHTVTTARREPIYVDQMEHYYENEEVWGTKLVARTTYESDYVTGTGGMQALQAVKDLYEQAKGLASAAATVDSIEGSIAVAGAVNIEIDLQKELDDLDYVIGRLARHPTDYDGAEAKLQDSLDRRTDHDWIGWAGPVLTVAINDFYAKLAQAKELVLAEKTGGAKADYGDLSQIDLELLASIKASGSQYGNTGQYELKAIHDYVEIPYIMSSKLVRKTRLKRVKTGEHLVTYTDKIRRFSHNETKHVLRKRRVYNGDAWEMRTRRVPRGYKVVTEVVQVPVYTTTPYTYYEEVIVPRALARTEVVASQGVIYIEKEIERLGGDLEGQLTLATNSRMQITNSVRYVDSSSRTRMLNGDNPAEKYESNPDYSGNSVLLLISRGDVTYSKDVPQRFEINGTLVSTTGKVAMEGLEVSSDGSEIMLSSDVTANPSDYVKESLRRLGGVLAAKRPVAAYVDSTNTIVAGFQEGSALMDANLLPENGGVALPPCTPQFDRPTWTLCTLGRKIDVSN
ncbi:MAG: hypothetical protein H6832_15040 [Planctomycetes bacterium]|nr:hypothetical protein [Planctomycetota bacterium]